jgi:hypothetical protein
MGEGNGQTALTQRMVDVLERIEGELKATNARLDTLHEDVIALRADVVSVKNEVSGLRVEMRADLDDLRHSHEARIARLEEAVFKRAS